MTERAEFKGEEVTIFLLVYSLLVLYTVSHLHSEDTVELLYPLLPFTRNTQPATPRNH